MAWVQCGQCKYGGNGDNQCIHGKNIKVSTNDFGCATTGEQLDKYKSNRQKEKKA